MKFRLRPMLFATALAAALVGAAGAQTAEEPRFGGTFISVLPDDPPTLASWISASFLPRMTTPSVVEGLVRYDEALNPIPLLAESWEVSPDGLQFTFNLRKDVKFHDGTPFDADDVVFSVKELWLKHISDARGRWSGVGLQVEKTGDHTVVFKLDRPFVYAFNYLGSHHGPIVSSELYEGTDPTTNPNNLKPIGTGPFKFVEYVKGSHIELVRNEDYWQKDEQGNQLPYLDRVVMRVIPDPTSRTLAMSKGEVDYQNYPGFPVETVETLRNAGFVVGTETIAGAAWIQRVFLNQRTGPLADVRVRRAAFHALDRDALLTKAGYGFGVVSTGPLNQLSPAYKDLVKKDLPVYGYDPEEAKRLLDEAGYPVKEDGTRFTLKFVINRSLSVDSAVADLMRDYFRTVGIQLDVSKVDEATRLAAAGKHDFDLTMLGGTISGPSPDAPSLYWLSRLRDSTDGWSNIAGINDPELDELLVKGSTALDSAERKEIWDKFQAKMVDDARELWLWDIRNVSVWSPDFGGLPLKPWGQYEPYTRIWWKKGTEAR